MKKKYIWPAVIAAAVIILLALGGYFMFMKNEGAKPEAGESVGKISGPVAVMDTNFGVIKLELFASDTPNTVENFVSLAKIGFYDGVKFHRVIKGFMIQGGDPLSNGTGGGNMPTELNDKPFVIGAVGVARGGDIKISNDAQFFITKTDASWLNNQYTNFGIVTSGMDIVNNLVIGDKILGITIN